MDTSEVWSVDSFSAERAEFFFGELSVRPRLESKHHNYLFAFHQSLRIKRDPELLRDCSDPIREGTGLPLSEEAAYYVAGDEIGILSPDTPPVGQPGTLCPWIPSPGGNHLRCHDGPGYDQLAWLEYLIDHFLQRWQYDLEGQLGWEGQDLSCRGTIHVRGYQIEVIPDRILSPSPSWKFGKDPADDIRGQVCSVNDDS